MAIVRNGNYWYYEWKIDGKKVRRSSGFTVDQISKEVLRQDYEPQAKAAVFKEYGILKPETSAHRMTLREGLEQMYLDRWQYNRTGLTSCKHIECIIEIIGNKCLDEITKQDLLQVRRELTKRGLKGNTANRYMAAIGALLNHAHKDWEVIERVPPIPKDPNAEVRRNRTFTVEEEEAILAACDTLGDQDFKDYFTVLLYTGMRKGELLTLTWERVNFDTNIITIPKVYSKTKKQKLILMTDEVREILLRRKQAGHPAPFSCYTENMPLNRLERAIKVAGIREYDEDGENLVLHSSRHTTASRLVLEGVPLETVAELLGHASVQTTEKYYIQYKVDQQLPAIAALDKIASKRKATQN